jgi:hypothetical protein
MANQNLPAGLYFGADQIERVRQQREQDAVVALAWRWLQAEPETVIGERRPSERGASAEPIVKPALSKVETALEAGLRYRFLNDREAGAYAARELLAGSGWQSAPTLLDTLMLCLPAAQTYALVQPLLAERSAAWLGNFRDFSVHLLQSESDASFVEQVWLMALRMVCGVVTADQSMQNQAIQAFRAVIDQQIHPEGYLKAAVEVRDGQTYTRQMLAVAGLSLTAEAAFQSGTDLWAYEHRDVSLNTAVTYLVYYYFYPEKWRWEAGLTEETTHSLTTQIGAFMEMAVAHKVPRGVEMLLDLQRPFFSAALGGLTTLTHYRPPVRKKGWFGR